MKLERGHPWLVCGSSDMPQTVAECDDLICFLLQQRSDIRDQLARTEMKAGNGHTIDIDWVARAQQAERMADRRIREIQNQRGRLHRAEQRIERNTFERALLDVLRTKFDDAEWFIITGEAKALLQGRAETTRTGKEG